MYRARCSEAVPRDNNMRRCTPQTLAGFYPTPGDCQACARLRGLGGSAGRALMVSMLNPDGAILRADTAGLATIPHPGPKGAPVVPPFVAVFPVAPVGIRQFPQQGMRAPHHAVAGFHIEDNRPY